MPKYRTDKQFKDICEDMVNGNWNDAGRNCAKHGFYAGDIRKAQGQAEAEGVNVITDNLDFVELIEIASKYR